MGAYQQHRGGRGFPSRGAAGRQRPASGAPATPQPDFFFRGDGERDKDLPRSDLLTDEAREHGEEWVRDQLNSSQLRRFFHEVKAIVASVEAAATPEEGFRRARPRLALLRSKAAYAARQGAGQKIPESFRRYLEQMVANVQDVHDLRAFALAFEAAVGYFYGAGGSDKGGSR
jgi:CRISPR type III-A-associated protein Csm2